MPNFHVSFPDRVTEQTDQCSGVSMASCPICSKSMKRGITIITTGASERDVWDRLHKQYPFEKIVVEKINEKDH